MKYLLWPFLRVAALVLLVLVTVFGFLRAVLRVLTGANQIPPPTSGCLFQFLTLPIFLPILFIYLSSARLYLEIMILDVKLGFAKPEEGLRVAAQAFPEKYGYWYMRFFRTEAKEKPPADEAEESAPEVEVSKAEKHFKRGAQLGDGGRLNEALAEFNEAIAEYSKATIVNPVMLAGAYHGRGGVYLRLGQLQQAIEDFDEALRLTPHGVVYLYRGIAYDALGQAERALQDLDEAIRLNPELALAYVNRAFVYIRLNKDLEAERDMDRAIALGYDPAVLRREIEEIKKQR